MKEFARRPSDGSEFPSAAENPAQDQPVSFQPPAGRPVEVSVEKLAGMGSWSWDHVRDKVIWSEGLYHLFQIDPAEPAPRYERHDRLYSPDSLRLLNEAVTECLKNGTPYQIELEAIRQDGSHFFLAAHGMADRDPEGRIFRLFGTVQDITNQKKAEQQVRLTNEELRQANARLKDAVENAERLAYVAQVAERQRSALLAVMSHEIRTPLNAILGMASLLETTPLNGEQTEYVNTLSSSGHGLAALLNDVLDFSKLEAGKLALERKPFSLLELAHESIFMFAGAAREKNVELTYLIDPRLEDRVIGDFYRLKQILSNLLGNALKFTHQGGVCLTMTTRPLGETELQFEAEVADSGVGISPSAMKYLFEPFQQADSSITRKFGGTGLGLAISRQLVELMKGRIQADSALGTGSTFRFQVVLEADPHRETNRRILDGQTIGYLSSSPRNQEMLASLVEYLGGKLVALSSPEHRSGIEVILADSSPGLPQYLDGWQGQRVIEVHPFAEKGVTHFQKLTIPCSVAQLEECFRKSLPKLSQELRQTQTASPSLRILVAEDNKINQRVIALMLQKLGIPADRVDMVINGAEALRELSAREYDLVLMDLQMPDVDGITATHLWRAAEVNSGHRVFICALTANATEGDRKRCLEVGMDDYLSKPIVLDQLRQLVEQASETIRQWHQVP